MDMFYVGMAQGKVAHILKPDSYVKKHGYDDYELTLCGRHLHYPHFENGLDLWGSEKPDFVPLCKKCEKLIG